MTPRTSQSLQTIPEDEPIPSPQPDCLALLDVLQRDGLPLRGDDHDSGSGVSSRHMRGLTSSRMTAPCCVQMLLISFQHICSCYSLSCKPSLTPGRTWPSPPQGATDAAGHFLGALPTSCSFCESQWNGLAGCKSCRTLAQRLQHPCIGSCTCKQ